MKSYLSVIFITFLFSLCSCAILYTETISGPLKNQNGLKTKRIASLKINYDTPGDAVIVPRNYKRLFCINGERNLFIEFGNFEDNYLAFGPILPIIPMFKKAYWCNDSALVPIIATKYINVPKNEKKKHDKLFNKKPEDSLIVSESGDTLICYKFLSQKGNKYIYNNCNYTFLDIYIPSPSGMALNFNPYEIKLNHKTKTINADTILYFVNNGLNKLVDDEKENTFYPNYEFKKINNGVVHLKLFFPYKLTPKDTFSLVIPEITDTKISTKRTTLNLVKRTQLIYHLLIRLN